MPTAYTKYGQRTHLGSDITNSIPNYKLWVESLGRERPLRLKTIKSTKMPTKSNRDQIRKSANKQPIGIGQTFLS